MRNFYLAVCGPIGAGKTALARSLAKDLGASFAAENFDPGANPFLKQFYEERDSFEQSSLFGGERCTWALATELSFLCRRVDMVRDITALLSDRPVVADWSSAQNLIFSRLTLSMEEFDLYRSLYDRLLEGARVPDLIICLDAPSVAPPPSSHEAVPGPTYMAAVRSAFATWRLSPPGSPVLWVDTAEVNVRRAAARARILAAAARHLDLSVTPESGLTLQF